MSEQQAPQMNSESMYAEDTFTDQAVAQIRRLTPAGALPLNFEIEAGSFSEATVTFSEMAQLSMQQTIKELEDMHREQA